MTETSTPQTVLITGAAVRIGRAIALELGRLGYQVAVHYNTSEEPAEQTVAEIRELGGVAKSFSGDLSDPVTTSKTLCQSVQEEFGHLDILINSASLFEEGTLLETTEEIWNQQFAVNLQAPFFLCQELVRGMGNDRSGQIINICDWRGEQHPPGHDAYTLTKSGLVAMTRMLAKELAPRIRVNGIHPGAVLAPPDADEDHDRRAKQTIPLNRTGSPKDIVRGVVYLLESEFVTGEILKVTGGEHLH